MQHEIKGFEEIMEFLDQKPITKVVSFLKKRRDLFHKWIAEYGKKYTKINVVIPDVSTSNQPACRHDWMNDFLYLIVEYSEECEKKNEGIRRKKGCKCEHNKVCRQKFVDILELLCSSCPEKDKGCKDIIINLIEAHFSEERAEKNRSFLHRTHYASYMSFGLTDPNSFNKLIEKDRKNGTKYYRGSLKKTTPELRLLVADFKDIEHNERKKLRDEYIKSFYSISSEKAGNIKDKEKYIILIASLYYQFFWDMLNKTIFRNIPNAYDLIRKTKDHEIERWIFAQYLIKKGIKDGRFSVLGQLKSGKKPSQVVTVKQVVNEIIKPEEGYDPNYKVNHPYFFYHEIISGKDLYRFLSKVITLRDEYVKDEDVEITQDISKLVDRFIDKKLFLRSLFNYHRTIESLHKGECKDKSTLERYYYYKTFLSLYHFADRLTKTKIRKSRRSFDRDKLLLLYKEVKLGKDIKSVVKNELKGEYTTWHTSIDDWKEYHPKESMRSKTPKEILKKSSDEDVEKWADEIEKNIRY